MKEPNQSTGDMRFKEFQLALLLLSWKVQNDRRWCRWVKGDMTIIVDKTVGRPSITEYTKAIRHQSWHRAFQSYQEAYDYIVTET